MGGGEGSLGAGGAGKVRKKAAGPGAGKVASWVWGFLNPPTLCQACLGQVVLAGRCQSVPGRDPGATRLERGPSRQHDDPSSARAGPDFRLEPRGTLGIRSVNATTWNDLWEHVAEHFPRRTWARRGDLPPVLLEANRGPGFTEPPTLHHPPDTRTRSSRAQRLQEQEF